MEQNIFHVKVLPRTVTSIYLCRQMSVSFPSCVFPCQTGPQNEKGDTYGPHVVGRLLLIPSCDKTPTVLVLFTVER